MKEALDTHDIHKYADATDIPKIEVCYRAIPRLLAKENRKFKYAEVEKGGSERKYSGRQVSFHDFRQVVRENSTDNGPDPHKRGARVKTPLVE